MATQSNPAGCVGQNWQPMQLAKPMQPLTLIYSMDPKAKLYLVCGMPNTNGNWTCSSEQRRSTHGQRCEVTSKPGPHLNESKYAQNPQLLWRKLSKQLPYGVVLCFVYLGFLPTKTRLTPLSVFLFNAQWMQCVDYSTSHK